MSIQVKEKEGEYAEKAVTPANRRESTRMTAVWAGKSMWIFGVDHPLRSWCMNTCRQKWFGHASTFVIFVNCIFLCLAQPTKGDCIESQATFDALGNPASGKFCPPDAPIPGMLPSGRNTQLHHIRAAVTYREQIDQSTPTAHCL